MGFLFIKPEDSNKAIHIFPAYQGTDGTYHTFNDEFDSIEEVEDADENSLILDEDSDDNKAICHSDGTTLADMGVVNNKNKKYCATIDEAVRYSATLQNKDFDVCGNYVRRLYKNDDDN